MNEEDLQRDITLLDKFELVRFTLDKNSLSLLLVADSVKDEKCLDEEDEGDDCCLEGLNGSLYKITFIDITDVKVIGEEADNYVLLEKRITPSSIYLKYEGRNLIDDDTTLSISFNYREYKVEYIEDIKSPEI